jgi:hypothetical protein
MRRKTYKMRRHKRYKYMKGGEDGDEMDEIDQTDDCPICLDPLNENVHTTECNHRFHNQCLSRIHNNLCPMCRGRINPRNINLQHLGVALPPRRGQPLPSIPLTLELLIDMMLTNQRSKRKRDALRLHRREIMNVLEQLAPIPRVERQAIINPGGGRWGQYYTPDEINEYTTKVVPYLNETFDETTMSPYELIKSYQDDFDHNNRVEARREMLARGIDHGFPYGTDSDSEAYSEDEEYDSDTSRNGGRKSRRTRRRTRTRKSKRRRTTKRRGSFRRRRRMSRRRVR